MNTPHTDWRHARHALQAMPHPASARSSTDFWRDFHARRALHPQHPAAHREPLLLPLLPPALAAACAAILLTAGLLLARSHATRSPGAHHAYAVHGQHASIVLTDASAQTTISPETDNDDTDEGT